MILLTSKYIIQWKHHYHDDIHLSRSYVLHLHSIHFFPFPCFAWNKQLMICNAMLQPSVHVANNVPGYGNKRIKTHENYDSQDREVWYSDQLQIMCINNLRKWRQTLIQVILLILIFFCQVLFYYEHEFWIVLLVATFISSKVLLPPDRGI